MQTIPYVSYDQFVSYRDIKSPAQEDTLIRETLFRAAQVWDAGCRLQFYPTLKTVYYDHPNDPTWLRVSEPLLEILAFYTQNGEQLVSASDYFLMCGSSYNLYPRDRIVMKRDGNVGQLQYTGTKQQSNQITGYFGYHEQYGKAFALIGDALVGNITATQTTFTVTDADGLLPSGFSPRCQKLALYRVDSEFMLSTGVDNTTNVITVQRGVAGTTATTHSLGSPIYVFVPQFDVVQANLRLADWFYQQKAIKDVNASRPIVTASGATIMPPALPSDVVDSMRMYQALELG